MPHDHDHYVEADVQHLGRLGQLPTPDDIAAQIAMHAKRIAAAERSLLESHAEIAKLLLLMNEHGYTGRQFVTFAKAHGVRTRTDAYDLLGLASAADRIVAEHEQATQDDPLHEWPSWRQALHDIEHDDKELGGYWLTPDDMYAEWDAEFGFDCDPFPYPRPADYDALDVEWGESNYVNGSFRAEDGGNSFTAVVRKAIAESRRGKTVVMPIPCNDSLNMLLEAGAEVRPLGRVKWLHTHTKEPCPNPGNCALFILHGSPPPD